MLVKEKKKKKQRSTLCKRRHQAGEHRNSIMGVEWLTVNPHFPKKVDIKLATW